MPYHCLQLLRLRGLRSRLLSLVKHHYFSHNLASPLFSFRLTCQNSLTKQTTLDIVLLNRFLSFVKLLIYSFC